MWGDVLCDHHKIQMRGNEDMKITARTPLVWKLEVCHTLL